MRFCVLCMLCMGEERRVRGFKKEGERKGERKAG